MLPGIAKSIVDPFFRAARKKILGFLKTNAPDSWRAEWRAVYSRWSAIAAEMNKAVVWAVEDFMSGDSFRLSECDMYGPSSKNFLQGYSVPLEHLEQSVTALANQKILEIPEFQAAQFTEEQMEQVTSLFMDFFFEPIMRKSFTGKTIPNSNFVLLDILSEAYRVDSDQAAFHTMVKLGSLVRLPLVDNVASLFAAYSPKPVPRDLVSCWKNRNKPTWYYYRGRFNRV